MKQKPIIKGNMVQYGVSDMTKDEFIAMINRNIEDLNNFIMSQLEEIEELVKLKQDFQVAWRQKGVIK